LFYSVVHTEKKNFQINLQRCLVYIDIMWLKKIVSWRNEIWQPKSYLIVNFFDCKMWALFVNQLQKLNCKKEVKPFPAN